jgi:hypothetical protein
VKKLFRQRSCQQVTYEVNSQQAVLLAIATQRLANDKYRDSQILPCAYPAQRVIRAGFCCLTGLSNCQAATLGNFGESLTPDTRLLLLRTHQRHARTCTSENGCVVAHLSLVAGHRGEIIDNLRLHGRMNRILYNLPILHGKRNMSEEKILYFTLPTSHGAFMRDHFSISQLKTDVDGNSCCCCHFYCTLPTEPNRFPL